MLPLSYIGLSILMLVLLLFGYFLALRKSDAKNSAKKLFLAIGGTAIWLVYLGILTKTEFLFDTNLPPRFPIFIFLPFTIFCIVFYLKNRKENIYTSIPYSWTVYPQTFRILVETLLLYTFYEDVIPIQATFEGLNFDIIMGITAPFMAYFIFQNKIRNYFIAYAWNILGILMILFVGFIIGTSMYLPHIWGADAPMTSFEFVKLPYLLIPSVLALIGIFLHVVSIVQLNAGRKMP